MNARMSRRLVSAMVAAVGCAAGASAQVFTWNGGDGLWSNSLAWTPNGIPNSPGALVTIAAAGNYTVGTDVSVGIGRLTLSNPTGRVAIYNGRFLAIQSGAGVSNDSTITVNATAEGSGTTLRFDVDAPLSGSGAVVLNANAANTATAVVTHANNAVLTQNAGHTIRGTGRMLAAMTNAGTIAADRSGLVLEVSSDGVSNSGVLRATGGGVLWLNSPVTQSAMGLVQADGASVNIGAFVVSGGLVQAVNSGTVRSYNARFDGVAAAGPVQIPNGYRLEIGGSGFTHDGVLTVNATAEGSGTALQYDVSGPLTGSGTVVLNANPANPDTAYVSGTGGSIISVSPAHTIRGSGRIYATMANAGSIIADRTAQVLQLVSTNKTNSGLIEATGGAFLDVLSVGVSQSGAGTIRADGGTTRVLSSTIEGGHIGAVNGGLTQVFNGTFRDVTLDGVAQVWNGYTLAVNGSALTQNGTLTVNPSAEGSGTTLRFDSNALLNGNGTVALNANVSNLDTAVITTSGVTFTQDPAHTIRGIGRIYAAMVNNGTIVADVPGQTLELISNAKTNNGLIRALGGATLWMTAPLTQGASGIVRVDDATLGISSTTVTGGQINGTGTGVVRAFNATLENASVTGPVEVPNGYRLVVTGSGFTHNGTVTVNPSEEGSGTQVRFDTSIAMAGTGDLVLKANAGNLDTATVQTSGTAVLTLPATQAIRGTGNIYAAMTNDGVVSADRAARTLQLLGSAKTNHATLKATGGGTLTINASVANGPGQIVADGGSVVIGGVAIQGGQIHGLNGGVATAANPTFTDVTSDAPIEVPNGRSLHVAGAGMTNNGTITVNPTEGGSGTSMVFDASGVLGGSGRVVLDANPGNVDTAILYAQPPGTITIGPSQTVAGRGRMYRDFVVQGALAPGWSGLPATFQADTGSITMAPTASLNIDIQGTRTAQWDRIVGNDVIALDGALNANFAYVPSVGESYDIVTGSNITGRFSALHVAGAPANGMGVVYAPTVVRLVTCYANCDGSTTAPALNVNDFICFQTKYATGDPYANCDGSTTPPVLNINDFVCFQTKFASGCQ